MGINPGGGGDAYQRTPEDARLYPLLAKFRKSEAEAVETFEAINRECLAVIPTWNLFRIVKPTLDALGIEFAACAYLNAVPYRTRGDRTPSVSVKRACWDKILAPTIKLLAPAQIVALGMKAGDVVERFYEGPARCWTVPRTIGDTRVSPQAQKVLSEMRAASTKS